MASALDADVGGMSNKELKELIKSAGLSVADLLEKQDIVARAKQAQKRLREADEIAKNGGRVPAAGDSDSDAPVAPKRRRRVVVESDEEDEDYPIGGSGSLIPEKTGATRRSSVSNPLSRPIPKKGAAANPFAKFSYGGAGGGAGGWTSRVTDAKTKARNQAAYRAAAGKKGGPPKKKKAKKSFIVASDEEDEEEDSPKKKKRGPRKKRSAFFGESDDEESVASDESSSEDDDEPELQDDDGDAYEKPEVGRKAQLDKLARERGQAAKPGRKAPAPRQTPKQGPAVFDLTADSPAKAARVSPESVEDLRSSDGSGSSEDESDDEAYGRRARKLLEKCGDYGKKLMAELRTEGLGATRGGALSAAAMEVCTSPQRRASHGRLDGATSAGDFSPADAAEVALCCSDSLVLQPHQVVGVNWLLLLEHVGANGVLADDMGLGKTVQTIAYLCVSRSRRSPRLKRTADVVVVPASTLGNWQREFKRFAPTCAVAVYHGSAAERRMLRGDADVLRADVVLTTYTWWERDACAEDRTWFASRAPWTHLVLDEGHSLKNPESARAKRLRALKAESRTILSGTPIMNRPLDLLSLLLFLMPKLFAACGVSNDLPEVLSALARDGAGRGDALGIDKLRELLQPFCLRRVKADVLDSLPEKRAEVLNVELDATQRGIYLGVAGRSLRGGTLGDAAAKHLFTELRKAANHPLLLRLDKYDAAAVALIAKQLHLQGHYGKDATLAMVTKELESYNDFDLHELCAEYDDGPLGRLTLGTDALFESAKCVALKKLLPKLTNEGHKVLLFSQWVRLLDLLGLLCDDLGIESSRLDGSTPITERQQLVADFNDPDGKSQVFLLSTRAGGLGINLTGADTVVIHDVDFNPEIDRQAEDRAHRIGQTKPVTVYRLVSEDTVDRDILDLANRKRAVNEKVMRDGGHKPQAGDEDADVPDSSAVAAALAKALAQYRAAEEEKRKST